MLKSGPILRGAVYRVSDGIDGLSIFARLDKSRNEHLICDASFQRVVEKREGKQAHKLALHFECRLDLPNMQCPN